MTNTWSNTWNPLISEMTTTKKVDGDRRGRVIRQNRCHALAPSTSAAASRSAGMACSPASRMTMTNPRSFHAEARITEGSAQVGSVHQPGWGRPRVPRTWSVSYTHLRAHETVLDLVCRLL